MQPQYTQFPIQAQYTSLQPQFTALEPQYTQFHPQYTYGDPYEAQRQQEAMQVSIGFYVYRTVVVHSGFCDTAYGASLMDMGRELLDYPRDMLLMVAPSSYFFRLRRTSRTSIIASGIARCPRLVKVSSELCFDPSLTLGKECRSDVPIILRPPFHTPSLVRFLDEFGILSY